MTRTIAQHRAADFQKGAAPDAQLFGWGVRALYVGPALNLSPHRNAVAVLALGLGEMFEVAEEPGCPQGAWRTVDHLLIWPDTLHHLRSRAERMAFLYVDPLGRDLERLRQGTVIEPLAAAIRALADGKCDWSVTRARVDDLLAGEVAADPRIRTAVEVLHREPSVRHSLASLAREAGLSASRFRRLFRAATGVTVRRYRLWASMGAAMRSVAAGESLTGAALDAGFSSSAHFSAAFREMFGLEPSRLRTSGVVQKRR